MRSANLPAGSHLILTPDAHSLLEVLQELGHLDEVTTGALAAVLTTGGAQFGQRPDPEQVELADLRRAAAVVLFERSTGKGEMSPEQAQVLEKEWHLLFG